MFKAKNIKSTKSGFSTVEMIIAMLIFIIIGSAIVVFQIDIFTLNKVSNDSLIIQEDARRTLKVMSAEIRTIMPSNTGSYAIEQTGTSSLSFYTNIDDDSLIEKVRYFREGNSLKKGTIKPSGDPLTYKTNDEKIINLISDLVNNQDEDIFSFYDKNYDGYSEPLTQPVDPFLVRLIKINIFINKEPLKNPNSLNLITQVSIRNLKDNL